MIAPDPREERLPKWAQADMRALRRMVEHAERVAEEARLATKPDETHVVINPYQDTIGLPERESVRFFIEAPHRWIDVQWRGEYVEIMGSSALTLTGQASNVMRASVARR